MKPLHLNLASRPFRDYRPVYAVVVVTSLLIALLMLNNVDTYVRYISETKTTRAKIASLEQDTEQEKRLADQATQRLKSINVKELASQTQFVNAQLAERAFSWSELLDRLESVMPRDVRIVAVAPGFDKSGLVKLHMECESKGSEGLVNSMVRLNSDPHFSGPFPNSQTDAGGSFKFGLTVDYRPSIARVVQ